MVTRITTARLLCRPFEDADAAAAHQWISDPDVMRFISYGPYTTIEQTAEHLRRYQLHHRVHGFGQWLVIESATGEAVGDAGIKVMERTGELELGYRFARPHWGRGFATEIADAWLQYGFGELKLDRIVAVIHPANVPSIHVVEKLGFAFCRNDDVDGTIFNVYERLRNS